MRKIIRVINNFFITCVLFVFYFVAIGAASVLKKTVLFFGKDKQRSSYWIDEVEKEVNFESPY